MEKQVMQHLIQENRALKQKLNVTNDELLARESSDPQFEKTIKTLQNEVALLQK